MKKADFILITVVAVIVGVILFFLYGLNNDTGAYVQIEIDGKIVETLPIDTDTTREITSDENGTNTLIINCLLYTSPSPRDQA